MGLATGTDDGHDPSLTFQGNMYATRRFPWSHQHHLQTPPHLLLLEHDGVEVGQLAGHQGVGILVRVESCPSFNVST